MLAISSKVEKVLPSSVKASLGKLSEDKQSIFEEEFKRKMKNPTTTLLLAIFLPGWNLVYLGKIGLAIFFWLTAGGFWVWYFVEIFTSHKRVEMHNEEEAKRLLRDMKIMDV